MQFQIIVRLNNGTTLPPSPPMDKAEAEADVATIRTALQSEALNGLNIAWLAVVDERMIQSASITPV